MNISNRYLILYKVQLVRIGLAASSKDLKCNVLVKIDIHSAIKEKELGI